MTTPTESLFQDAPKVKPMDANTAPYRKYKPVVVDGKERQVEVKK